MRLYFPVDLTGEVSMIEKLVLGGNLKPKILSQKALLCHQVTLNSDI